MLYGVDVEARHQIWSHIRQLRAGERSVILATNYLDEAEALCDRIAILRSGRVVAEETPAVLKERTGTCLELECASERATQLASALSAHPAVMRLELADVGIRLYLRAHTTPEDLVRQARAVCPVDNFRTRSPDLVEVFRALTTETARESIA